MPACVRVRLGLGDGCEGGGLEEGRGGDGGGALALPGSTRLLIIVSIVKKAHTRDRTRLPSIAQAKRVDIR